MTRNNSISILLPSQEKIGIQNKNNDCEYHAVREEAESEGKNREI